VLLDPPAGPSVLVVGASRQRHACLHAGLSSRDRLLVGTDLGQATYSPVRHEPILRAVEDLRSGLPTTAILSGCYSSVGVAHFGASAWQARERVIAPWRGDPVLDLLCLVATKPETSPLLETSPMIDPSDAAASRLLYLIAAASSIRATDGKMFWSGFFRHRVQRFATLPLSDAVSRLLDAVHAAPAAESTQEALASLASLSAQEQTDIETALRRRAALCVALAYDQIHEARVRRTQRQSETLSEASASPAPALNLQASLFGAKQE
jgi:hypothetical protein